MNSPSSLTLINARLAPGPWSPYAGTRLVSIEIAGGRIATVAEAPVDGGRVIDVEGAWAFPGFVDAHTHLGWAGEDFWTVRWDDAASRAEALEAVRTVCRRLDGGFWILGGDWLPGELPDPELPSLEELDSVTGGRPLLLVSRDRSRAVLNSRALELSRICRDTADPAGGRIERDTTGEPTGRLRGEAVWGRLAVGVVPPPNRHRRLAELRSVCADLAARGVTEIHDIGTFPREDAAAFINEERSFTDVGLLHELEVRGALPLRVSHRPSLLRVEDFAELARQSPGPDELVTFAGFKMSLDNGWFSEPAGPRVDSFRYPGRERAARLCALADALGATVSIHAIGDLGVGEALDLIEGLRSRRDSSGPRHRVIHARRISEADIERSVRLGVALEVQPWEIVGAGRILVRRGGPEFTRLLSPYRAILDRGGLLAFSSDRRLGMRLDLVDCDPLTWLQVAVTRTSPRDGVVYQPEQAISPEEAMACLTVNAATASGAESRRGRVAPGCDADLVVLSGNPMETPPSEIARLRVELTVSAGRVAFPGKTA